jgi:tRNA(Ile)-lysidine synthase
VNPTTNYTHTGGERSESAAPLTSARGRTRRQTPDGFEQRLLSRARIAGFTAHDRIVVGFSGGRDSLALAAALRWVQASLGLEPLLVHIDHRLRASSAEEATRAAGLARSLDLKLQIVALSKTPTDVHPGVGLEEAARRERYRSLFAVAERCGARAVATAHHRGDQAETVLLHLLRGGGVHGAAGMAERSRSPVPHSVPPRDISHEQSELAIEPWLWRPLLREPRAVIEAYVAKLGLSPIEDPSNHDPALRRNALRHEVLPVLESHVPGAEAALARYATLAAEDDRALEAIALTLLEEGVDPGGRLAPASLRAQSPAIQRRVVRGWLARATGASMLSAERTDAVLLLAESGRGGAALEIGEGWTVRLERGMLHAERTASRHEESP